MADGSTVRCAFSPHVERAIQDFWNDLIKKQPKLYDGPLLHVENVQVDAGKKSVSVQTVSDVTYRQLIGLRNSAESVESVRVLSILLVPVTTDGISVLQERAPMGDWGQLLEFPGGFVVPKEVAAASGDLFAVAAQKAAQEFGDMLGRVAGPISWAGAIDCRAIHEYMLVYKVRLSVDFASYKARRPFAHAASEESISRSGIPLHGPSGNVMGMLGVDEVGQ